MKLSNPGYDDKVIPITFSIDGWYFGNILIGGLIGLLIVDPATGAMWKMETEFLNETLTQSASAPSPELSIMNIDEMPENWQAHLVKVN